MVKKLVVFQMPPEAEPTKTVLPVVSEGSTAMVLTAPAKVPLPLALTVTPAGPTAVKVELARALDGARLKIWKYAVLRSIGSSARPVAETGFWKVSDQFLSVPVEVPPLRITRFQVPSEFRAPLARLLNGPSGWNGPTKNGAPALSMEVLAVSLKVVLLKLAVLVPPPTLVNRFTLVPSGASR